VVDFGAIRIDQGARTLVIDPYQKIQRLDVYDLQGRAMIRIGVPDCRQAGSPDQRWTWPNCTGVYLFQLHTELGPVVKRFFLEQGWAALKSMVAWTRGESLQNFRGDLSLNKQISPCHSRTSHPYRSPLIRF